MLDWWKESGPPVYIAAAGYLGLIKPSSSTPKATNTAEKKETGDLRELLKMAGPGGMFN